MAEKLRIGVIFGGRSGEHEVSIASAASVMAALDTDKYEIIPIGITHEGRWLAGVNPQALTQGTAMDASGQGVTAVAITGDPTQRGLVSASPPGTSSVPPALDVVLPVLHGPYGEDGTLQGLLEMAGVPYAGSGVLGAALGMDKEKAKQVFLAEGLPVVEWLTVRRHEHDRDPEALADRVEARFAYPVFVKPANLGSSVGVGRLTTASRCAGRSAPHWSTIVRRSWSPR